MATVFLPGSSTAGVRVLPRAPQELTSGPLKRLGEGIGRVVYASEHWVIKRDRSRSEVLALIVLWKLLRKLEHILPRALSRALSERPSRQIRFLRLAIQLVMALLPKALWLSAHVKDVWKLYRRRSLRGEKLAEAGLTGSHLIPERICFPPIRVHVGGWPGEFTASEATERVDMTLYEKLAGLAAMQRFSELERWLDRFLEARKAGWRRGLFSLDSHLKNYGVIGDRIVLLDTGGLTNRWQEIEARLAFEEQLSEPHRQLGLATLLESRPDIAARFDMRWKAVLDPTAVRAAFQSGGNTPQ